MATQSERTKRVQVRLSDDMYERLTAVAADMGMPPSTIGSVAISEYVMKKEREARVASASTEMVGDFFKNMENFVHSELER